MEDSSSFDREASAADVAEALRLDRRRRRWAIGLSAIAPGAGLVVLRREWLGLTTAVLFAVFAQPASYGWLIDPTFLHRDIITVCTVAAGIVWVCALVLTVHRANRVLGERARREIASIVRQTSAALADRRYADAIDLLNVALRVNDESVDLRVALARVRALTGQFEEARAAWETVLDLDVTGAQRAEAITALERLP